LVRAEIKRRAREFQAAQLDKQLKIAKAGAQATWAAAFIALISVGWSIAWPWLHRLL
jgi:hypothetical protein